MIESRRGMRGDEIFPRGARAIERHNPQLRLDRISREPSQSDSLKLLGDGDRRTFAAAERVREHTHRG